MTVGIAVQATPSDRVSWLRLAQEIEAAGFQALYTADHPGTAPSPFVALAAAAAVTERIALGTCVLNAGMWEPVSLASEVATLDIVSGGRAVMGVGAGHTPQEWAMAGRPFPSAAQRVERMIELAQATQALLEGRPTSLAGRHFSLVDAVLYDPRPVQERLPLLVGGNGDRVLKFAAQHADIVGITGLVRTLADGHRHAVDWSDTAVRRTIDNIVSRAGGAGREPQIEALVQVVEITNDAPAVAGELAQRVPGASPEELLGAPFVWIGTVEEIRHKLEHLRNLGIHRYVIRPPAIAATRQIFHSAAASDQR